ncbi:MAG: hydrogenase maturation protease [Desulfobacteraceae bacterium]|jgi:hydrogenase maturation protease
MPRVLVIGWGNPARGDDGLAWHALEHLAGAPLGKDVTVILRHQLTFELAERVLRAERVLFVDASAQGPPGRIRCRRLGPGTSKTSAFSHHLTPGTLLALTQTLFGRCPEAFSLSIGGADFSFSEALSPQVRSSLPRLLDCIRRRL